LKLPTDNEFEAGLIINFWLINMKPFPAILSDKSITIDTELKYPPYSSVCSFCVHWNISVMYNKKPTCKAFPKGIPERIWLGKVKHKRPVKGQENKVVYSNHNS